MFAMRSLVSHPAVQLRSVSHRYHAMNRGSTGVASGRQGVFRRADEDSTASQATRLSRLEAVLFLSRESVGSRKLAQLANLIDGTEARTLMRRLNKQYDADGRAFHVEEIAQGYQLLTRPKFAPWLRRLTGTDAQVRFSHPALETLAVVAYRQPVLRAEIESIRGVQCGEILRQLMERGMVRIVGRADELGRPMLYGTTRQFLQTFGLKHLEDLPRAELLRRSEELAGEESIENDDMNSELANQQEANEMSLDPEAETSTAVAELDGNEIEEAAMGDEIFDEDIDDDDDGDFDDDDDEDDDEDDVWKEVDDKDVDEEDDDEDDDKDGKLAGDDSKGNEWDDDDDDEEDDDWEDDDDDWEDKDEKESP